MTIYLCGFMGCGKSTIGTMLSDRLGMNFTDLDSYITEKEKMSIPEIFSLKGEAYFRSAEVSAIRELSGQNTVIACGGGTILNDNNAKIANQNGKVIFLDVSFQICYERIKGDKNRPLVINNSKKELEFIFDERHSIYMNNSSLSVNADASAAKICEDIISKLKLIKK